MVRAAFIIGCSYGYYNDQLGPCRLPEIMYPFVFLLTFYSTSAEGL